MSEVKNTTFAVACGNNDCGWSSHILGTANTEDTLNGSIRNPKNLQFCSACGEMTQFECPECRSWHEVHNLLNKPYICPTVVNAAVEKFDSLFVPNVLAYFVAAVTWLLTNLMAFVWCASQSLTNVTLLGYSFGGLGNFAMQTLLSVPIIWLAGSVWIYFTNKKRKVQFVKDFPNEWKRVQRFPNGLN